MIFVQGRAVTEDVFNQNQSIFFDICFEFLEKELKIIFNMKVQLIVNNALVGLKLLGYGEGVIGENVAQYCSRNLWRQ